MAVARVNFLMVVSDAEDRDLDSYDLGSLTTSNPDTYTHEIGEFLRALADEIERVDDT